MLRQNNTHKVGSLFPWRFGGTMVVGYLLATVPQVIVDPLLQSHVNYPRRTYPFAYLITPIAIAVFVTTVITALRSSPRARLTAMVPFIASCVLSAPIFTPEVPHGNLVFVGVIWALLGCITLWVHGRHVINPMQCENAVAQQARLEYIKEQTSFWKGLGYGLTAAYLGALIALVQGLHKANAEFVSSQKDLLLMARYINVEIAILSVFMFVGPLYEIANKVLSTTEMLLDVTEPA